VEGIDAVKDICDSHVKVAVLVLSGNDESYIVDACLNAGAVGFLPKDSDAQSMLQAVCSVYEGEIYMPDLNHAVHKEAIHLSPRQREIFVFICEGKPNKEIAYLLSISESTVKQHISELFRKLKVSSRAQVMKKSRLVRIQT